MLLSRLKPLPSLPWLGGFVVLDKPPVATSAVCSRRVQQIFDAERGGHGGTLDPMATGVLPIALNSATRTLEFVFAEHKCYRFTVQWGAETDTDDMMGRVLRRVPTSSVNVTAFDLDRLLDRYRHTTMQQVPPQFCALRINGERAHDIARRGDVVPLEPRPVRIYEFIVEQVDASSASFFVRVSPGTYVRSLARDLGRELGVLGHVSALRRTAVGALTEQMAVSLDTLAAAPDPSVHLLPVNAVLRLPTIAIQPGAVEQLALGRAVPADMPELPPIDGVLRFLATSVDGSPIAIAELHGKLVRPVQVLAGAHKLAEHAKWVKQRAAAWRSDGAGGFVQAPAPPPAGASAKKRGSSSKQSYLARVAASPVPDERPRSSNTKV